MRLNPKPNTTKKQKAAGVAAALWAGKRSGRMLMGAAVAILALVTLKAVRSKLAAKQDQPYAPSFPDTTPVPDPGQATAGSPINGSAPQPDPAAPFSPPVASGSTPPHGDVAADVVEEDQDGA